MSDTEKSAKTKKFRSPNYPFIGLEEAIKKSDSILKSGGLHEVPFQAAMTAWNYKAGSTQQAIAALKAFGLITVTGEGDKRKVQLTESARKILKLDHPERPELLKTAALLPTIYNDLWIKFKGDLPPLDSVIANYLEFEKKFNPDVISGLIKDFKDSITYANLTKADKIEPEDEAVATTQPPEGGQVKKVEPRVQQPAITHPPVILPPLSDDGGRLTVELLPTEDSKVLFEGEINEDTLEFLTGVLKLKKELLGRKRELERQQTTEAVNPFPKKAMWRNKDHDEPVTIIGKHGDEKGIVYYAIEGSETGIPETELDFNVED